MSGKSECIPYPYVGSKVSLISKSERRYEGILLYTMDRDTQMSSDVALAKVHSFGTEDRPTDRPVAPSDEDFGYMTFCGSDIKEIRVCKSPSAAPGGPIGGKAHGYGDFNKTQINDECQKQVINHLDSLFTEKNLADVEITCEGEVFNCHQNILSARSPVFLTMFRADMSEKHSKKVHIPDVRKEVFLEVLKFIYTGNVSSEDSLKEHAREILAAANKYELDLLKKLCEAQLVSALDASNCLDLLVLGDLHEAEKLKMVALDFVSMNFPSLVQQDIYKDFIRQYPDLVFEVTKSVASKMESNNN